MEKEKKYDISILDDIYCDSAVIGRKFAEDCEWDGTKILEAAANALTDANFHVEAAKVRELLAEVSL